MDGPVGRVLAAHFNKESTPAHSMASPRETVRVRLIEDLCPDLPPPLHPKRQHRTAPPVKECAREISVATAGTQKLFYLCRDVQLGPATGRRGIMATKYRRPYGGILGELALKRRLCRQANAIEPELALVMANLAQVLPGSRVLDPFCGSCSLLIPAAKMGARTWGADISNPLSDVSATRFNSSVTAVDVSLRNGNGSGSSRAQGYDTLDVERSISPRRAFQDVYSEYKRLGLAPPELYVADVAAGDSPIRHRTFYDAIITDPPYNVKHDVIVKDQEGYFRRRDRHNNESKESAGHPPCNTRIGEDKALEDTSLVWDVLGSLLALARYVLKPGGRLCLLVPMRGPEARVYPAWKSMLETLCEGGTEAESFRVVHRIQQRLTSPNMCRWLVVLKKEGLE